MYLGFQNLLSDITNFLPRIPEVVFSFLIGYLIITISIQLFTHTLRIADVHKALIAILKSLVSIVLWIVLSAHLLRNLGLSQIAVTLSGSLIIIGLAIANGAQSTVADVIAGLFLARDPDFDIGFRVKSGETEGVIESIDIRKTRIRTANDTLHVVPNSLIDKERWQVIERRLKGESIVSKVRNKLKKKPRDGASS